MATLRSWKRLIEKAADPVELRTRARAIDFSLTDLDSLCTVVAARRRARNRAATHESERSRAEACARSPTERAMERLESGRRLEDAVSETMALRRIARHDETGLEKTWEATPARVAIARRVLRFRPDLMRDWIVDPAKSGTVVLAALAGLAHRDWPRAEQAIDAIEESDAGMRALLRARLAMQQERLDDAGRELEDAQRWSRHFSCRRTEAAALAESARLALRKREPREATQFADRALRLRRACGDYWGEGDAQALLAEVAAGRGDLPAAKKSCEAVAAIRQAIGDRRGLGLNLVNLANLTSQMGEPSRAIYEEAIVALRAVGAKRALAGAKTNLAVLLRQTGSTRRAEELLNEVLEEHRAIGGRAGEAITLENLAILAFRSGRIGAAREGHRDALRIFREIGDMRHVALVEENMATIEAETGNPRGALELLESARRVHEEGGDQRMEAHARGNLAILWTRIGFPTRAIEHYEAAIEAFASVGDKRLEGRHVAQLALLYAEAGAPERAERVLRRALKLHRRVRDRRYEGETLTHLGALAIRAGRWKKAKAAVAEGLAIHRAESHGGFEGKARALLGEIALAEGETEEAEACFRKALALHAEHRALGEEARTRARLAAVAMRRGELTRVREMARHALRILDRIHEPARRHELL
ncbi:MAG: hypothetical protein CME06_10395, partial [Gemmatimonadetes bacterium]|nr:hypothetical protein [Gemmatimonadota bacterium]